MESTKEEEEKIKNRKNEIKTDKNRKKERNKHNANIHHKTDLYEALFYVFRALLLEPQASSLWPQVSSLRSSASGF